jgi:hypothetical protein
VDVVSRQKRYGLKYLVTRQRTAKDFAGRRTEGGGLQAVSREVVGIHVLLARSLFGGDITRNLLRRASLAKSTSAPLRY